MSSNPTVAPSTPNVSSLKQSNDMINELNSQIQIGETAYAKLFAENGKEFYMKE